jgi:hypothetical protein
MGPSLPDSQDVLVRRCRMRVVRRGGWSWGRDPRGLAAAATRALPALVAEALAEALAGREGGVQTAPVRVRVRVTLAELAALGGAGPAPALSPRRATLGPVRVASPGGDVGAALRARVRAAVAESLAAPAMAAGWRAAAPAATGEDAGAPAGDAGPGAPRAGVALLARLAAWHADGALLARLAAATDDELDAWHRELFAGAAVGGARPAGVGDADVARVVAAAITTLAAAAPGRALEARLVVAVAAWRTLGVHPADPGLRAALDAGGALARSNAPGAPRAPGPAAPARATVPAPAAHRLAAGQEREVRSALPFLVLGALARWGWLDAAAASLHAAGAGDPGALAAFATALAYKLLGVPERGWRRSSDDLAAAACFAGVAEPLADAALADLASRLEGRLDALDAAARAPFVAGHVAGDPILVGPARHGEREGFLLAEAHGGFALAWARERATLAPLLAALGAGASAGRGEPWERALSAWHAVAVDRPVVPRAAAGQLDASLSLAASLALADIAWRLFQAREPTDASLALARFGDLGAHVRVEPELVRVRLPLGRRYQDLLHHGFLARVVRVPWWGGRALELSGG